MFIKLPFGSGFPLQMLGRLFSQQHPAPARFPPAEIAGAIRASDSFRSVFQSINKYSHKSIDETPILRNKYAQQQLVS